MKNPFSTLSEKRKKDHDAPVLKPEKPKKSKKKQRARIKWAVGCTIVAGGVAAFFLLRPNPDDQTNLVSRVDLTWLAADNIEYTISGTGRVESNDTHKVYASQTYRVEEVLVEVGDYVRKGQQLLALDTTTLREQIETKEISMTNAEKSAALQVKSAQDTYLAAKKAIEDGTNSSLMSAEANVRNTYDSLVRAQKAYNEAAAALENGLNTNLITQESSFNNAHAAFQQASDALGAARGPRDAAQQAYDAVPPPSDPENPTQVAAYEAEREALKPALDAAEARVSEAERAYASAESAYENAKKLREIAYSSADSQLDDYRRTLESAKYSYESALKSQEATAEAVQNSLQQNRNSLTSAQLAANTDLSDLEYERLLRNLDDAQVTADYAGTITAVYAAVGSAASGILFVIEDIGDLLIETTVSEYDVGTVQVGMAVAIKSEATGETVYDGRVISIAPTSNKNMQGDTDRTGDAVFATKIKVISKEPGLRIGMSVRINYIVERQEEVLAVPYDAVYINDGGASCIMVLETEGGLPVPADEAENGEAGQTYILREIPVICGLENDISIVVSGEGIRAGLTVVNSPANYREMVGQSVTLTDQIISNSEMNSFMGMRF